MDAPSRAVFAGGEDDEVACGVEDVGAERPAERPAGVVGEAVARQVDRAGPRVVELQPVRAVPVFVEKGGGVAGCGFVEDDGLAARRPARGQAGKREPDTAGEDATKRGR